MKFDSYDAEEVGECNVADFVEISNVVPWIDTI